MSRVFRSRYSIIPRLSTRLPKGSKDNDGDKKHPQQQQQHVNNRYGYTLDGLYD